MDVAADNPALQHFKKQGPFFIWIVVANAFWLYMALEFLYQHAFDDEVFKKPLPPPLDTPNPATTPDTKQWNFSKTDTYRYLVDAGHIRPIQFEIKDGKKVYSKWAGVNKPMEDC